MIKKVTITTNTIINIIISIDMKGLAPIDNFNYYGLRNRLKNLYGMDAKLWDSDPNDDDANQYLPDIYDGLHTYKVFDAIVTDPPFGRREKAMGVSKGIIIIIIALLS